MESVRASKDGREDTEMDWYSVWAVPSPESPFFGRMREIIKEVSAEYESPTFEPHMTIIGSVGKPMKLGEEEVRARTQALARSLKPFNCRITNVAVGSQYFRCVYLLVDTTDEVMRAHWQARLFFGLESEDKKTDTWSSIPSKNAADEAQRTGYMPHMSLIYSDVAEEVRQRIKAKVESDYRDILLSDFVIDNFSLYRTDTEDRELQTWEKIADFRLGE